MNEIDFVKKLVFKIAEIGDKKKIVDSSTLFGLNLIIQILLSITYFLPNLQENLISINQMLDYEIHRWGVPLCVLLLLEKDLGEKESTQPFVEYIESFESSEIMSRELKNHESHLASIYFFHNY
ncbi:hypothetical protein [Methanofervidicoccus abyssi]|uniref:Uncharacterized protein n=1 Tax=Methanofervidicoccus abyssi TaxID=2082189 RepID=A0A401HQL7_9EURY|nr:hypothetical protein [Methanofervidicoccus abyssi]GBF36564.1 hypothetical protein MHHB_P0794 [Methanofervidicoccus abyssi]